MRVRGVTTTSIVRKMHLERFGEAFDLDLLEVPGATDAAHVAALGRLALLARKVTARTAVAQAVADVLAALDQHAVLVIQRPAKSRENTHTHMSI